MPVLRACSLLAGLVQEAEGARVLQVHDAELSKPGFLAAGSHRAWMRPQRKLHVWQLTISCCMGPDISLELPLTVAHMMLA